LVGNRTLPEVLIELPSRLCHCPSSLAMSPRYEGKPNYISNRRLAELIRATTLDPYAALNDLIARHRPRQHATSRYAVRLSPATHRQHACLVTADALQFCAN
jgi:hypothetical protein